MKRISSLFGIICLVILSPGRAYAQPYATNVVGYVNTTYPVGWSLIANPLDDSFTGNRIAGLFGSTLPAGSTIYTWGGGGFHPHYYDPIGGWGSGTDTLVPGQGALLYLPSSPSQPIHTWVGSILGCDFSTDPTTPLPVTPPSPGVWLLSSFAPFNNRTFEGVIGRAPNDLDAVLTMAPSGVASISIFDSDQAWWVDPLGAHVADPTVALAYSSFFDLAGNSFAGFQLPSEVPEPTTTWLLALGGAAVCAWRRRNRAPSRCARPLA
jgi:hypothetical protein